MKIAQVVITKTTEGSWKATVQSLQQVEVMFIEDTVPDLMLELDEMFHLGTWEQLSIE